MSMEPVVDMSMEEADMSTEAVVDLSMGLMDMSMDMGVADTNNNIQSQVDNLTNSAARIYDIFL